MRRNRKRRWNVRDELLLDDLADGRRLVDECTRERTRPGLWGYERAFVEINLAQGLFALSMTEGPDRLPEACALLEPHLSSDDSKVALWGAFVLLHVMLGNLVRSDETDGVEAAVTMLMRAIGRRPSIQPQARAVMLAMCADALERLAARASGREARRLREAMAEAGAGAGAATPSSSPPVRPPSSGGVDAEGSDLDRAIARGRDGLATRRDGPLGDLDLDTLTLVVLLVRRASARPDGAERDGAEALRLCDAVIRDGGGLVSHARILRPMARAHTGADDREIAAEFASAFDEAARISASTASEVAAQRVAWALRRGIVAEAAEGYRGLIRATVDSTRRRVLRGIYDRELSALQGLAADAGSWLLKAGRPRDAVMALELARATQLSERLHRRPEGLADRLVAIGRPDLAERWSEISARLAHEDRAGLRSDGAAGAADGVARPARADALTLPSFAPARVALSEHETIVDEIARLPGFDDVVAAPSYEAIRASASEGPIVYLAATSEHGYAVVVRAGDDEPVVRELPGVTSHAVEAWVSRLQSSGDPRAEPAEFVFEACVPWLWRHVVAPVWDVLREHDLATLVPIGALGALPVHAAAIGREGGSDDPDGSGPVLRYAPNARVLGRAQANARAAGGSAPSFCSFHNPADDLELANAESDGVARILGDARRVLSRDATPPAVMDALDDSAIWHFACHGEHHPERPLESALWISETPITLRAILARPPGRHRLAVLSACATAVADHTLYDEVVSFPSALLEAGVAGVVATQIGVNDTAAAVLVLRFFERCERGEQPVKALASAQQWMRTATTAEIGTCYPEIGARLRATYDDSHRPFVEAWCWAPFCFTGA